MANYLNSFFSALSDPTRRAVIERLAGGPASVSDLAAPHDMALPTFLRHLKVLEDSGLVRSVKKGRVRTCHIEAQPLIEAQGWLAWQRAVWEGRNERLAQLAEKLEQESGT
jgi:DNA-binding transcriptional ArsR family regulator